jgi:single-stranded DNA-binding protein
MSLTQDRFEATLVGNLIAKPTLVENEDGSKVCLCRVATNPRAKRFDNRTGKEIPAAERSKYRSVVDLKVVKQSMAERFAEFLQSGDRVILEGHLGTKKIRKGIWSPKEQKLVSVTIDIDNDGQSIEIMEDRLVMWVHHFSKVVNSKGNNLVEQF